LKGVDALLENPPSADGLRPDPREYVGADGPLTDRPSGLSLSSDACRTVLLDALSGIELGPWDERMIDWFVGCDHDVLRTLVSLLVRVRDAGAAGRTVRPASVDLGPAWITIPEICSLLQISPGEWHEWQQEGPAPLHVLQDDLVLVRRSDFERWVDGLPTNDFADAPLADSLAEPREGLADIHLLDEYVLFPVEAQGADLGRQGSAEVYNELAESHRGLAELPQTFADSPQEGGTDG